MVNPLPKYDFAEGLRSIETERKVQEHMSPSYRKIYLSFGNVIKGLMVFTALTAITYYIFKYQTIVILLGLLVGIFGMVIFSIIKQTMRKVIRGKYNI